MQNVHVGGNILLPDAQIGMSIGLDIQVLTNILINIFRWGEEGVV